MTRSAFWVGMSLILCAFVARVFSHFDYTPDDTFIYLQYARNVLGSHEVSFNPGEPSYGITGPLWLALVSGAGLLGFDLYLAAKVIDLVVGCAAIVALARLQNALLSNRMVAFATAAVFSTHVWFLRWAGTGMEASLATLLSVLTLHCLMKQQYHLGAVYSALLTLTRPEAMGLVAIGMLSSILVAGEGLEKVKKVAVFAAGYLVILLPWYLYAYTHFGTIVPNTALAKSSSGMSFEGIISTVVDIGKTLAVSDGIEVLILLFVLGTFFFHHVRGKREVENGKQFLVPLSWIVGLPLLYVVTLTNVVSRYLLVISPMILMLAFGSLVMLQRLKGKEHLSRKLTLGLALVLIVQNIILFEVQVRPHLDAFAEGMHNGFIKIGQWLHENTSQDDAVLVADIGAIGYFSERKICDAAGLVSPELLPLSRMGYSIERIMREPVFASRCNARYVVERSDVPNAVHPVDLQPVFAVAINGLGLSSQDTAYYTVFRVRR
ncbi:MAG: hypothetical protein AAB393_10330 [Bacteroidota bacterium]